ncbi:MAG: FAD-dependent oxidoreductase [Bacteroidetes bacterium]|nr:FAD-dependent oxidoreductase [bacterium]NBP64887.1 FAD-dependent oxidoreductase [Bacteroidota bacterium]
MKTQCLVIGAGYAGLATAALLAKQGKEVILLEKHTAIGGCASFFRRMKFTFDVGATTLSGLRSHQPLGRLFSDLQLEPHIKHCDPGMVIHLNGHAIIRHADQEKWIAEAESHFGKKGQRGFWKQIHAIDATMWEVLHRNPEFPPTSIIDVLKMGTRISNLTAVPLLRDLFRPMDILLEQHGLQNNALFKQFINEQLLISTQSFSDTAPIVTGAMGLAYPADTYYPIGGITKPAQLLVEYIRKNGGQVILKEEVQSVKINADDSFTVITAKGNEYHAEKLYNSIPMWNMKKLAHDNAIGALAEKSSNTFKKAWGAFTAYFAIESTFHPESPYAQIHTTSRIPHCHGDSFFVTWSPEEDSVKAPQGWSTITISTHTEASQWFGLNAEEYARKKEETLKFILSEFDSIYPHVASLEKHVVDAGTPATFEHYTGRYQGFVGGLPHSIDVGLFSLPKNITSIKHYAIIGDTSFPGQGTPAVVMSAYNAVK